MAGIHAAESEMNKLREKERQGMQDLAIKVAYKIMQSEDATPNEQLAACRMILAQAKGEDGVQSKIGDLFDALTEEQGD